MRIFNKPPKEENYFPGRSVQQQPESNKLFVASRNDQVIGTGRSTTLYRATDESNDPAFAGSFFLLPDPYCEDNDPQDFLLEEEEMILYDLPIITNHSLHKI